MLPAERGRGLAGRDRAGLLPWPTVDVDPADADAAARLRSGSRLCGRARDGCPGRRELHLGARRRAVLRRRGGGVHQRTHAVDRRVLRGGRRRPGRAPPRGPAGRRWLELLGRARCDGVVVRLDHLRARGASRVRADRRGGPGRGRAASR